MSKILIIDDDPIVRTVLKRTLEKQGYQVTTVDDGEAGIYKAKEIQPALIVCDWMMSNLDGLEVCRRIKSLPELASTFFILLTAKGAKKGEEEERVRGLDAGADEFISKPIEMNELKARVRAGLRLHQLHEDLKQQKQTLEELNTQLKTQKTILENDLAEAYDYVKSLLPSPLSGNLTTTALFLPSSQLGGDCFDYYWLDQNNLAIYLLDVSGHGVGSALLSVSVLNALRSQYLAHTDFSQPGQVLKALNKSFQMSSHGDKYFTIWYGVYNLPTSTLVYANAGHPAAILLPSKQDFPIQKLDSLDLPIGFVPDTDYGEKKIHISPGSNLYVFSDGVYEIVQQDGSIWGIDALVDLLVDNKNINSLNQILTKIKEVNKYDDFDDDLSLLKISF